MYSHGPTIPKKKAENMKFLHLIALHLELRFYLEYKRHKEKIINQRVKLNGIIHSMNMENNQ